MTLATLCEELTHWKRPWCWEGLEAGREGDDRGWDGWMASPTRWTWVWVNSGSWWWTGRPGMLRFTGSQRGKHNWVTELNWTELYWASFHVLTCQSYIFVKTLHIWLSWQIFCASKKDGFSSFHWIVRVLNMFHVQICIINMLPIFSPILWLAL